MKEARLFTTGRMLSCMFANFLMLIVYNIIAHYVGFKMATPTVILIVAILSVECVGWFSLGIYLTKRSWDEDGKEIPIAKVDPWQMQRDLMAASGQALPSFPTLSNDVLLYAALNMEEMAETFQALAEPMRHTLLNRECNANFHNGDSRDISAFVMVQTIIRNQAESLDESSKRIRKFLQEFKITSPLSTVEAAEILDGITDLAVVNAGFALAAGLPGARAYLEVAGSNLSKTNPNTGVIDKTPDGKWIKGANYFQPDLIAVLHAHARGREI